MGGQGGRDKTMGSREGLLTVQHERRQREGRGGEVIRTACLGLSGPC